MILHHQIKKFVIACFALSALSSHVFAQITNTQIKGFAEFLGTYEKEKVNFALGEQDLFITSELHDKISFLGESVFKYSASSPTFFDVSIERIVIKYNVKGNHNLLFGKHHTPINYWNDTYHHGRVFFPTIYRPLLFSANIIPLHTTGISLQGHDFGKLKWGYDVMIGNGLGSTDVSDNDKHKSITAAFHCKPLNGLRLGASYYLDNIATNVDSTTIHSHSTGGNTINPMHPDIKQQLAAGSVAYFGKKFEFLCEATFAFNSTDSLGTSTSMGMYAYAGIKIKEKFVPYVRFDLLNFDNKELYYVKNNTTSFVVGMRYEVNYLTVVKLEYQHDETDLTLTTRNMITAQIAIGF